MPLPLPVSSVPDEFMLPHFLCDADFINSFVLRYLDFMCFICQEHQHLKSLRQKSYLPVDEYSVEFKHALCWPFSLKHFQGTPRILKKTIWETLIESPCYVVEVASKLLPKVTELIEVQPGLECLTCLGWLLVLKKMQLLAKYELRNLVCSFLPLNLLPLLL